MELNGNSTLAVPLDSAVATLELVGGKGASLARLARAGLAVPPGFHLTTVAYRKFIEENSLQRAIVEAVYPAAVDDPASLDRASEQIRELIGIGAMPGDVAAEVRSRYSELGEGAVAVRSSATAQDLPGMSFAGQLETYLNVCDANRVLDAVQRCWARLLGIDMSGSLLRR